MKFPHNSKVLTLLIMEHSLGDITTARLTAIHRHFGTISDVGVLARLSAEDLNNGPWLFEDDVERLKWGMDNGIWVRFGNVVFARDGRKVLAFARQYAQAQRLAWQESVRQSNEACFLLYVRYALKYIITDSLEAAREMMRELFYSELDADGWALLDEIGGGWLRSIEIDPEIEKQSGRVIARAFIEARDNMETHLEKLWLELFAEHGVDGAKEWMKAYWTPASQEAKDAVNAAYVAAKRKFTKQTK